MRSNTSFVLLGIFLILVGLMYIGVDFLFMGYITGILAIAAGVMFLIRR